MATTPPTLADNLVFPNPNTATLTVPCGTLEAYSSATSFWNMFFMGRISEDGYEVVANVNNDAFGSVAIENNCSTATLTATANEGYVFLSWNDGNTENPRVVSLTSDTAFTAIFALIDESSLLEAEAESISFFPNPTKSEITFSQAIEKVEVIDLTGKTIFTFTNAKTINIESLPAGAYYLRLTNEEKTSMQKVIKQ
ncbi:MAG: T9SS type A sorting domain-containing protein [Bacteroidales bacterium]|nr:T9SS type A sorting domain-containing protein [Bacteroidales bacterium]